MTILLIEDDKRLAEFITFSLPGDTVVTVHTLEAAHVYLAKSRPHMMVVDLNLPDSKGLETLIGLRRYSVPRVVLTSHDKSLADEAVALGAIDYITKTSSSMSDLIDRIRFNLAKFRPRARFSAETFREIRACLAHQRDLLTA